MKKEFKRRFISLLLSLDVLLLAGCAKNVKCDVEGNHIHIYTNEEGIDRYVTGEKEYVGGFESIRYDRTDNYIELNDSNEELYKFISNHNLVNIMDNYDELNYISSNLYDYLEFKYRYTHTYITTDGKGHNFVHSEPRYSWTTDPNHSSLTGDTRIVTHIFYGYNIIKDDKGKFKLQKSSPVQDINLLIEMGYKYIDSEIVEEVLKDDYLRKIGIKTDTDEYIQEYDGEKVILKLK